MRSAHEKVVMILISGVWLITAGCSDNSSLNSQSATVEEWSATAPDSTTVRSLEDSHAAPLKLNLKPGDKFPLRKIVEQELIQDSVRGSEERIKTRLELMFAISVVNQVDDRTQLKVRYDRVRYSHRVGEDILEYDSTRPPLEIPHTLRAYHDMVGDGFTFWLGQENQIVAVDGFTDFLNRCLRNVPETEKHLVVLGIEAGSGEAGIANFVDNSIGLLPYQAAPKPGDTWSRPSHIGRPVPMHVNNIYTLQHLDDTLATVDIRGQITPSTTMTAQGTEQGVRVTVTGGETSGRCVIFRETGLPQQSRVEQIINMNVLVTGALEFKQQKKITTTITAFPVSSSAPPTVIGHGNAIPRPLDQSSSQENIRPVSGP